MRFRTALRDHHQTLTDLQVVAVGIDPGHKTGLFCISIDASARDLVSARWIGSASIDRHPPRKHETPAQAEVRHFNDIFVQLSAWKPEIAVIERPADAMVGGWNKANAGKPNPMQGRATAFSLGASYGVALAAVGCIDTVNRINSYQIAGSKKSEGWMPKVKTGNFTHTMKHEMLAALLRSELRVVSSLPIGLWSALRDDELMAFGVLRHHIVTHGLYGSAD